MPMYCSEGWWDLLWPNNSTDTQVGLDINGGPWILDEKKLSVALLICLSNMIFHLIKESWINPDNTYNYNNQILFVLYNFLKELQWLFKTLYNFQIKTRWTGLKYICDKLDLCSHFKLDIDGEI